MASSDLVKALTLYDDLFDQIDADKASNNFQKIIRYRSLTQMLDGDTPGSKDGGMIPRGFKSQFRFFIFERKEDDIIRYVDIPKYIDSSVRYCAIAAGPKVAPRWYSFFRLYNTTPAWRCQVKHAMTALKALSVEEYKHFCCIMNPISGIGTNIPDTYLFNPIVFEIIHKSVNRDHFQSRFGLTALPEEYEGDRVPYDFKWPRESSRTWAELIAESKAEAEQRGYSWPVTREYLGNGGICISDIYWNYFDLGGLEAYERKKGLKGIELTEKREKRPQKKL